MTRPDLAEQSAAQRGAALGLLAELAVHERNAIHRASQVQFCAAGEVLPHANSPNRCALFPIDAVFSVMRHLHDERGLAAGLFGNEGVIGVDIAVESKVPLGKFVVQSSGDAYCLAADDFRHQFDGNHRLQRSIVTFMHALLTQVAQNTICVRNHNIAQRLAKWLLMIDDRSGAIETAKAKALLAGALDADEATIERTLSELVSRGAILQKRNTIGIERDALEVSACECYESIRGDRGLARV